jgi:hypothetical protein
MRFRVLALLAFAALGLATFALLGFPGCTSSYKAEWGLEEVAPDGESMTISVAETCGGDAKFDHAEFSDVDGGLVVTIINSRPWGGCDDDRLDTVYQVDLPRPLGDDEILQGCWGPPAPPGCYKD